MVCVAKWTPKELVRVDMKAFCSFILNNQVLLELLQAGGIVQFEESRLIRMAEKAEL